MITFESSRNDSEENKRSAVRLRWSGGVRPTHANIMSLKQLDNWCRKDFIPNQISSPELNHYSGVLLLQESLLEPFCFVHLEK